MHRSAAVLVPTAFSMGLCRTCFFRPLKLRVSSHVAGRVRGRGAHPRGRGAFCARRVPAARVDRQPWQKRRMPRRLRHQGGLPPVARKATKPCRRHR
eukprot:6193875-Pleurochrysis_carterae.AAC.2